MLGAHDFGSAAPNSAHTARDNTNSDVKRPWTMILNRRSYLMTSCVNVFY